MFRKAIVYPNGNIEYYYDDKIIVSDKNGKTEVKHKGFYGNTYNKPSLSSSSYNR